MHNMLKEYCFMVIWASKFWRRTWEKFEKNCEIDEVLKTITTKLSKK
jgi:hypothetical protein